MKAQFTKCATAHNL